MHKLGITVFISGLVVLLAACAAQPPAPSVGASAAPVQSTSAEELRQNAKLVAIRPSPSSDDDFQCTSEQVTGTHGDRRLCATRAERQRQRSDAQDWLRSGGRIGAVTRVPTVR